MLGLKLKHVSKRGPRNYCILARILWINNHMILLWDAMTYLCPKLQRPVNWTIIVVRGWMLDGCSRESVKVFETENVSTWGGLEPPTSGFMPNALTIWAIRARHLLSHVFEYWLWWYRYFGSNVNIWNVNCARATAFIFDTWADVPVKVSKLFDMA